MDNVTAPIWSSSPWNGCGISPSESCNARIRNGKKRLILYTIVFKIFCEKFVTSESKFSIRFKTRKFHSTCKLQAALRIRACSIDPKSQVPKCLSECRSKIFAKINYASRKCTRKFPGTLFVTVLNFGISYLSIAKVFIFEFERFCSRRIYCFENFRYRC